MKRIGGRGRNTRSKYKKHYRRKGKISIKSFLQELNEGDRVSLKPESSYRRGLFHPRFFGKIGFVERKSGSCYYVSIKDNDKRKSLLVHPVHLKKV